MAYVRTVKTSSGATAVQIVWSSRRGSRQIEHLGSAHDEAQVEVLKAAAAQRVAAGQQTLDLGLGQAGTAGGPLEIVASCSEHLWQALCQAYRVLGFDGVLDGDEVLRGLVLARIIEPGSKVDALRVLAETGVQRLAYRTLKRRLPAFAKPAVRQALNYEEPSKSMVGPDAESYESSTPSGRRMLLSLKASRAHQSDTTPPTIANGPEQTPLLHQSRQILHQSPSDWSIDPSISMSVQLIPEACEGC